MDAARERRLVILLVAFAAAWLILLGRLVDLQVIQHAQWRDLAETQHTSRLTLKPARATISDRDGHVLAQDLARTGLEAYPRMMKDPRRVAAILSGALGLDADSLADVFDKGASYVRIAKSISPEAEETIADSITAWKRHGRTLPLHLVHDTERVYPFAELARCVLGKTNPDGIGIEGVESAFDSELRGTPGWSTVVKDGREQIYTALQLSVQEPRPGRGLQLTLDASMQAILESNVREAVAVHKAKGGLGIIVDPRTGDVLAMVSVSRDDDKPGRLPRNRAVADQYEPGSTFKLVVASAAIQEKTVTPDTRIDCERGNWAGCPGGHALHDAHGGHGVITFREVIGKSSNIGSAKVALMLGGERYDRYMHDFGFGAPTGIGLSGESGGLTPAPGTNVGGMLAHVAIGQSVAVTPLQLTMAYAAIANDGVLLAPRLVRGYVGDDGRMLRENPVREVRRVVSSQTARTVRDFLAAVVDSGTATQAKVDFGDVGGKTGTAQKPNIGSGGYSNKFLSSFVGMVPIDNPRLVCTIMIDEPSAGGHYGGVVAAPVFKRVLEAISRLPGAPVGPEFREIGTDIGDWASATPPATLAALTPDASAASLDEPVANFLPSLKGRPMRDAFMRLRAIGLTPRMVGSGVVVEQSPPPGTLLDDVSTVVLRCRPDAPVLVDAFADSALASLAVKRLTQAAATHTRTGDVRE